MALAQSGEYLFMVFFMVSSEVEGTSLAFGVDPRATYSLISEQMLRNVGTKNMSTLIQTNIAF